MEESAGDNKKTIFFVDDEVNLLKGLKRMLKPNQDKWDMHFLESGEDALEALKSVRCDVIVSDMRMPEMQGNELLRTIRKQQPHVNRIVLSGQAEPDNILEVINYAHLYFAKPCEPDVLIAKINQIAAIHDVVQSSDLLKSMAFLNHLPSPAETKQAFLAAITDPGTTTEQLIKVVTSDAALSLKALQLTNSSFFGKGRPTSDVAFAAKYLGPENLKEIFVNSKLISSFKQETLNTRVSRHNARALEMRTLAYKLAKREKISKELVNEIKCAGYFSSIGYLAILASFPEHYANVTDELHQSSRWIPPQLSDLLNNGVHIARAGGYLAALWGLPDVVINAITYSADPENSPDTSCPVLLATHVSAAISSAGSAEEEIKVPFSRPFLEKIGRVDSIQEWEMAASLL